MTGIYLRMLRDEGWLAIEVENLTDEEWERLRLEKPLDGWGYARAMARWIRANVREGLS